MNLAMARESLESSDSATVIAALTVISKSGQLNELQSILPLVKSAGADLKKAAINAACKIIRDNLVTRYNELESGVREKLGTIMASISPTIVDELSRDLYSEDEALRLRTVQIMGLLKKNPRVKDVVAGLVPHRDERIRATAVSVLGKVVGPQDTNLILQLMSDKDKRVRANTIEALESLGNPRLTSVIMRFKKDPSNRIRGNVLKALFNLGHTDIDNDLLDMIKNTDNFMKASAFWVVSQIGIRNREIADSAGFYLLSDNEMVANNAHKALTGVNDPRAQGYLNYLSDLKTAS
ncbi:MAG: hypothetical protein GF398_12530 [Chitinivibrionales bacterium]|nr:hypothetical protein [Chitinivibrionales bacterium]